MIRHLVIKNTNILACGLFLACLISIEAMEEREKPPETTTPLTTVDDRSTYSNPPNDTFSQENTSLLLDLLRGLTPEMAVTSDGDVVSVIPESSKTETPAQESSSKKGVEQPSSEKKRSPDSHKTEKPPKRTKPQPPVSPETNDRFAEAVVNRGIDEVRKALSDGALVNYRFGVHIGGRIIKNVTALHILCYRGIAPLVQLLLDQEAEINAQNSLGETPLHVAVDGGHLEIVKALINAGADSRLLNQFQKSPLDYARLKKYSHIISYLENPQASGKKPTPVTMSKDTTTPVSGISHAFKEKFDQGKALIGRLTDKSKPNRPQSKQMPSSSIQVKIIAELLRSFRDPLDKKNDQTHLWKTIIHEYNRTHRNSETSEREDVNKQIYDKDKLRRAASLLSEHNADQDCLQRLPSYAIKDLHIIEYYDKILKDQTTVGRLLSYRQLCSLQSTKALLEMQKAIKLLVENENTFAIVGELLSHIAKHECYFISSLVQEPLTLEPEQVAQALNCYFSTLSTEQLTFIAHTPLAYFFVNLAETLALQLNFDDELEIGTMWLTHQTGLTEFLQKARELKKKLRALTHKDDDSLLKRVSDEFVKLNKLIRDLEKVLSTPAKPESSIDLFVPLLKFLFSHRSDLLKLHYIIGQIDTIYSLAKLVKDNKFSYVTYKEEEQKTPSIEIRQGWCPWVQNPIPFSCKLGGTENPKTIIVTGHNNAGKSIFIKTVGLITLLSHTIGIVPAESVVLTPLNNILTHFNVRDSIAENLSTSEAQLKHLQTIMTLSSKGPCLIILDEPINSVKADLTEQITTAFLKKFTDIGHSLVIIATHCETPATLATTDPTNYAHYQMGHYKLTVIKVNPPKESSHD